MAVPLEVLVNASLSFITLTFSSVCFICSTAVFIRKLEDLTVDEFLLSGDLDSEVEDGCEEDAPQQNGLNKKNKKKDKSAAAEM